ncbi:MAG TPA: LamG-like jellyroll fold domain-containing protein [Verrucomicrobiae bacterium]|nr:LamG-like jellyroll fold domain-containing protein [Verrucomicrobiae bacterium]
MKLIHIFGVLFALSTLHAQTTIQVADMANPTAVNYFIGQQGANSRVWQTVVQTVNAKGNTVYQTNQAYVELATGLNHLVNGQWVPSSEQINISPDGSSAWATNGQHQVYFPGNIYNGEIKLVTPDGQTLQSQPIGLSYFDGTNSVLLAVVTNATGAILSSGNQVTYTNAFASLNADLLYTYTKAGFEQDVVLRAQPPDPASLGLNPQTTRLQVLTEFFNPPQPNVAAISVPTAAGNLEDDTLSFGTMQMGQGKAFLIGANSSSVEVDKRWLVINGRQFLIEEVPVASIAGAIDTLPPFVGQTGAGTKPVVSKNLVLPVQRLTHTAPKTTFLAKATLPARGLVLDYVTMTSQTNYTFRGDTTYYISSAVNLYGSNTFEGGAVIKYTNNASINLNPGPLALKINWLGTAYRPVVFTAKDDNSVGEAIGGSTGNPTNYYAATALSIVAPSGTPTITSFRIAYAQQAVLLSAASSSFYNGQIVNCQNGFSGVNGASGNIRNVLFSAVQTNFNNLYASAFDVQNATFNSSAYLATINNTPYQNTTVNFENCIMANVTTIQSIFSYTNSGYFRVTGSYDGLYNCPAFGTSPATNTFYPFQAVGAGSYYLTNGCTFTNIGTPNIDSALLVALGQKTVYPPLVYSNQFFSANTNFTPQAPRDTTNSPSLGYHYDPIDYLMDYCTVSNATLTVTNGVVLASYNEAGIRLQNNAQIVSVGLPVAPNWFVRYSSVQEQPTSLSGSPSGGVDLLPSYSSVMPSGQFRFTKFACPAGGGSHLYDYAGASYSNLLVQDSEFWSGTNYLGGTNGAVLTLKNSLFARSVINASGSGSLSFSNNLAWGDSSVQLNPSSNSTWYAFNNDFDSSTITSTNLTNGYNAYLNCTGRLYPTNVYDILTNATLAYQIGPFGGFYQPTNSPLLNKGNATANLVGLYHYTVTTNEVVEGTNIVSMGYHYVAADTNGIPLDSNGDGIPDYLEDANGDGIVDNGETNWGLAILTQPVSETVTPGTNATFNVGAGGIPPLSYQWYFNSTNVITGASNAWLTVTNVQTTNQGGYSVVVTNFTGSLTSSVALLILSCDPAPSGLVGWWRGESNALDSAGTNNGTYSNGVTFVSGQVGLAFNFDGTNGKVTIPDSSVLKPTNLTIEAWVKFNYLNSTNTGRSPVGEQFIVEKPSAINYDGFTLYKIRDTNTEQDYFVFGVNSSTGTGWPIQADSAEFIQTNVWYHIAGVRGPNYIQLYTNGVLAASNSVSFQQSYGNYPLFFGSSGGTIDGTWDGKLNGSLDEVSLYNRALSANEIMWIYEAGTNRYGKCTLSSGPTVQIVSPINQTLLARSNVVITATNTSSAMSVPIAWVEFFDNTTNSLGFTTTESNGLYQINWIPAVGGTNVLTAFVMGTNGLGSYSNPVTNYVRNLPAVIITGPTNGQVFSLSSPMASTNITIHATATADLASITNVAFYQGTNIIGATNAGSPSYVITTNFTHGVYTLTAQATDSMGSAGISFPVNITVEPTNQSPYVYAGPDQTTNLPTVQLDGFASDDGLPSNYLAVVWSRLSGPGTNTFGNSTQAVTTATFSQVGTNILQLLATDGQYTSTDTTTVTILVSNLPPTVNAGQPQTNIWPALELTNALVNPIPVITNGSSDQIIGVDYYAPSNAVIVNSADLSGEYGDPIPYVFKLVSTNGAETTFATNLSTVIADDEVLMCTVRDTLGDFNIGDIFVGDVNGNVTGPSKIWRITNGFTMTDLNYWINLTNNGGGVVTAYVDRTGVWGGNLIAVTMGGEVWRINSQGQSNLVAQLQGSYSYDDGALTTIPNDSAKYGPWAGRILVGWSTTDGGSYSIYAIDTNGVVVNYPVELQLQAIRIIPPNENLFLAISADGSYGWLWTVSASDFRGMVGDIAMVEGTEGNEILSRLHWNGNAFEKSLLLANGYLAWTEQMNFMPAGVSNDIPNWVQLNGSVSDDGQLFAPTSNLWAQVSGPAPVTFDNPNATNTIARFTEPGIYVLALTAYDGQFTSSSNVTIAMIRNQLPVVNAGTNQVLTGTNATLTVTVTDDGWPSNYLAVSWSQISGPGNVSFTWTRTNQTASGTNFSASDAVSFSPTGTYVLQASASDGQATSTTQIVVTAGQPQLTLTPAYAGVFPTNAPQTFTATLINTSGSPLANTDILFTVTGVNGIQTNYALTDAKGVAQFMYCGPNVGRDFIVASTTNIGLSVTSAPAVIDWGYVLLCGGPEISGLLDVTNSLDTVLSDNDPRPANYAFFSGSEGTPVDIDVIPDTGGSDWPCSAVLVLMDSSFNIIDMTSSAYPGLTELTERLPYTGNYIVEITTAYDAQQINGGYYWQSAYTLQLNCLPSDFAEMQVLLNGTNVPNGGTLIFGPITTNATPVSQTLTITNTGNQTLHLGGVQVSNTIFSCPFVSTTLSAGSSTNISITFNASSNVVAVGSFSFTNDSGFSPYVLTLLGSAFPPGTGPAVQIGYPLQNGIFWAPAVIPVTALVETGSATVASVTFQASTTNGLVIWGVASNSTVLNSSTNLYLLNSPYLSAGDYTITAVAEDTAQRTAISAPVTIHVLASAPNNHPPVAVNDQFTNLADSVGNVLYVLTNDYDPDGNALTIVSLDTNNTAGSVAIINGGSAVSYTPPTGKDGTDGFRYEISDGQGGTAWAQVLINIYASAQPTVSIISPPSGYTTNAGSTVPIVAQVTPYQNIAKVDFYQGQAFIGEVTTGANGLYTNSWQAVVNPCGCGFTAQATDIFGQVNTSQEIQINVTTNGLQGTLTASLDSISNANGTISFNPTNIVTIRDGLFILYGRANHSLGSNVVWQLGVYSQDGTTLLRNLTPASTGAIGTTSTSGILVTNCDLTTLQNGVYDFKLTVNGGYQVASTDAQFILDSNLKLGQFSFSQQDLVIPVNGIPLTVTRTYSSLNPDKGDFGYGWTYSLSDMDVVLDETRQNTTDLDGNTFSERTGGNWDVTLTLPNGQRTTFYFQLQAVGGGTGTYNATWQPEPGVTAKLGLPSGVDNRLETIVGGVVGNSDLYYWDADPETPWQSFDFPGFVLTMQDGTQYTISRQDLRTHFLSVNEADGYYVHAYGTPYLSQIQERSGDTITINPNSIVHRYASGAYNQVVFQRNADGLISSISDPNGLNGNNPSGPPAVVYQYDDQDNLIAVERLVDRNAVTYVTNSFAYTNANFPHYITAIVNGDGTQVAENFYDDNGKLTAVTDANGNTTHFIHNETNNMETVVDRLGNTNTYVYDLRGNILVQTNALGQVTTMAYDINNNKTSEVTYLGTQPYATNSYVYNTNLNVMVASTDPLGHTNGFTYDPTYAYLLTSTDALGHITINTYDGSGNLTSTTDALTNATVNFYSGSLMLGSRDPLGTLTTNSYDGSDNLIGTETFASDGVTILSTNSFGYDANDNRTNSTVWRKVGSSWIPATTTYVYDAMNRVVQTVNPDGGTNTVVYNAIGQQQATIDPLGRTTSYLYDSQGRLIQTAYPDGSTETNGYDANGNRIASADQLGRVTTYAYDGLNRLYLTIYPDNTTNTTRYDGVGRVAQTVDPRGTITAFAYDAAGRRLAVTNAVGISGIQNISSYTYDANGNQITFMDANSHITTNVFDALNRQIRTLYPDGTTNSVVYDADGRRVAQTNQNQIATLFGYDGAGRLTSVTNALNQVTHYQYDAAGNETAQIDALNRTNLFAYDGMGRRISHTMPGGQGEGLGYDLAGNLIYDTNFNNVVITNQYDALNRLINRASVNGYTVSYTYTLTGQRQTMTDPSGIATYSYDNRDRLQLKTENWSGGPIVSLNYAYDADGNLTNLWSSTANGVANVYQYDALNRLTSVLANDSAAATYAFDLAGNLQAMQYANGVTNLYQYDSLNRLTNSVWKTNGITIASFTYTLGLTGNRTALLETNHSANRSYTWTYDPLYRLTNETVTGTAPTGILGYLYDAVGNRTVRTNVSVGLGPVNQMLAYNTNDWLTTNAYDSNGNTLRSTNAGTASGPYYYDAQNHLTNYNSLVYLAYNGDGIRVEKTVNGTNIYYLVDDRNPSGYAQVLEEWTSTGTPALAKVYNYGLDLISQRAVSSQPSTNYFVYDGHGSTRMLTDAGGNFVNAFTHDAFGTLIASNGAPQTVYLYCGEQFDPDLGFYYLRARYLDQNTGRFWTMDSFEGNNEDPSSLHKYVYAEDNPINLIDPTGFYSSFEQFLGYDAEQAIDDEYLATHAGQARFIQFGLQQQGVTRILKPDIFNSYPSEMHFLEIKPISFSGVSKGVAKIALDTFQYKTLGFSPDTQWQPPSALLKTPNGETILVRNVNGILFYQDIDLLEWKLVAAAIITTPKELLDYLTVADVDALEELAPIYVRATAARSAMATLETAEIEDNVDIGIDLEMEGAP